jgi:peptide/nickel transport system permease protein
MKAGGNLTHFNYIIKRIAQMIPVLFVVTILVFSMIRLIPGDPATALLGEMAKQKDIERLREQMGLNENVFKQYVIFMKNLFVLDFGRSFVYKIPVIELVKPRIAVTVCLTVLSMTFAAILGFPLGYWAGMRKDRAADQIIRVTALACISLPNFWVGLLLMILFGVKLRWLPVGGWGETNFEHFKSLILPGITSSAMTAALIMRNLRNSVVDINSLDYVDFARSKGISEARVSVWHILRNGLISTVTLVMMRAAWMLGGSVIIETVFALPGMGKLLIDSIFGRDYAVVQALVFMFSALVIIVNLITDVIYSFLDPRVTL